MNWSGEPGQGTRHLRTLLEAAHGFASNLSLDEILDRVLALARELTDARYAAVGVLNDARTELAQFRVVGLDSSALAAIGDRPRGRGVLGLLITDPRPLRLASVGLHPLSYGFPAGHPPMSSFLGAPIVIDGAVWGNLYLTDKSTRSEFSDIDEEIAVVLAAWAAVAIATSRRVTDIDQQRTELRDTVATLQAAETAVSALGDAPELSQALGLLVKRARDLVDARSLICIGVEREELVLAASAGEGSPPQGRRLPAASATPFRVAVERPDDPGAMDAIRGVIAGMGIGEVESALVAPVVRGGRAVGALIACDRRGADARFTARDRVLLRSFAGSAATAVALGLHDVRRQLPLRRVEDDRPGDTRRLRRELERLMRVRRRLVDAAGCADSQALRQAVRVAAAGLSETTVQLRSMVEGHADADADDQRRPET